MPIGIPLAWQNRPELLRLHCPEGAAFCFDCFRAAGETAIKDQEFRTELIKRGFPWKKTKKANVFVGIKAGIIEVM